MSRDACRDGLAAGQEQRPAHGRGINLHILTGVCAGIHRPDGATNADKMLFMRLAGCGGLAAMAGVPGLPRRRPRPGAWRRSRETVSIQRISSVSALRAWTAQASARTRGSWTRPIGDPWQHPARVRGWRERGAPPAGWLLPLDRTVQPGPFRGHAPAFGIDGAGFQKRQAEHNGRRQSSAALRASWQARSRPSVGSPLAGTRRTANLSARLSVGPPPQPGF